MRVAYSDFLKNYSSHSKLSISGDRFNSSGKETLATLIFDYCSGCLLVVMAALPQGAFAAHSVRKNMEKKFDGSLLMNKPEETKQERAFTQSQYQRMNQAAMEHPPLKYNSKLMNSIWGLYNRYSVHNFKKNTDGKSFLTC